MRKLLSLIILLMAGTMYAQTELPEMGSIKDLAGKTKVYLSTDVMLV